MYMYHRYDKNSYYRETNHDVIKQINVSQMIIIKYYRKTLFYKYINN